MYTGYPNFMKAREICERHLNYPVTSWRNYFVELANQLAEYDGDVVEEEQQVKDSEFSKNQKAAELEESLNFELDGKQIIVNYQNLYEIKVNFYIIDLEILFSRSPFMQGNEAKKQFQFVRPNVQVNVGLKGERGIKQQIVKVPQELVNKNLFVSISCKNNYLSTNYYSSEMKIHVFEHLGQVKVSNKANVPLSKVYCKVYSRDKSQTVSFFRDGNRIR